MPRVLDALVSNASYAFIAVGVGWAAVAVIAGSTLVLWPVVACLAGGVQLRMWPGRRLTWAWAVSTAVMGFLLAAYLVYAWLGFLGGAFSNLAAAALVAFVVLAAAHVVLFYAGSAKPRMGETPAE